MRILSSAGSQGNTNPIPLTFMFDEDVKDFSLADITVTPSSATLTDLMTLSQSTYTASLTMADPGKYVVAMVEGAVVSVLDGRSNAAARLEYLLGE